MKKCTLSLILICCVSIAKAQLTVNSNGTTSTKVLHVYPDASTTQNNWFLGIDDKMHSSNHAYTCGLASEVYTSTLTTSFTKHAVGVRGEASDADGMNYGIYGVVCQPNGGRSYYTPMNYGAGVYGSSKSSMKILSSTYAGYFDGLLGVSSSLTVNGSIYGNLLSNSIPSSSVASNREYTSDVSKDLSHLRMASFYLDQPKEESIEFTIDRDSASERTLQQTRIATPLSSDEAQRYSHKHYGLDADQLEEVFPDLVYENEDGSKSINYVEMVPILVQAINELKAELTELRGSDEKTQTRASEGDAKHDEMGEKVTLLSLGENRPNPFSNTTAIPVSIPEDVQRAFIYVYDLTGKKVQQVDIPARGKQNITLDASALTDGMYLYSLIADGKVVQTRRMIVEK